MRTTSENYISIKLMAFFTGYFLILILKDQMFSVALVLVGLYGLSGKEQALKTLSLVVITKYLNPGLYDFATETGILAWGVFLIASLRLVLFSLNKFGQVIPLLLFSLVVSVLTVFFSKIPDVSGMKLVMFTVGCMAIILGFSSLTIEQVKNLRIWFFSLVATIILLSLPTFIFPEIAYNRNGLGFQGILNHPQSFGPMLSPFASWYLVSILFVKRTKIIPYSLILCVLLVLMIYSQARTSIAAVMLSFIATFLILLFKKKKFNDTMLARSFYVIIATVFFSIIIIYSSDMLQDSLSNFAYKRGSEDINEALSSRSGGVLNQWLFFLQSPWVGNGFAIYPWGELPLGIIYFNGIPISAPVEKGFLPTAILEEIGLIGTAFFIYFIYSLYKKILNNVDLRWLAMFLTCIFINGGEVSIFSMGGLGLFYWLLIGLTLRNTDEVATKSSTEDSVGLDSGKNKETV